MDEGPPSVKQDSATPEPHAVHGVEPGWNEEATDTFESFYKAQTPRLVLFLLHHGADPQLARDLTQEAMVECWRRWTEVRSPKTYVRKIASKRWGRILASPDYAIDPLPDLYHETDSSVDDCTLAEVLSRDHYRRHLAAIAALPTRQRQVMAWTLDGYEPSEIARILNITAEAVRASLYKARATLSQARGDA